MKLILALMLLPSFSYAGPFMAEGKQLLVCVREDLDPKKDFKSIVRLNWGDWEREKVVNITAGKRYERISFSLSVFRENAEPEYNIDYEYQGTDEGGGGVIRIYPPVGYNGRTIVPKFIDSTLSDVEAFKTCH